MITISDFRYLHPACGLVLQDASAPDAAGLLLRHLRLARGHGRLLLPQGAYCLLTYCLLTYCILTYCILTAYLLLTYCLLPQGARQGRVQRQLHRRRSRREVPQRR